MKLSQHYYLVKLLTLLSVYAVLKINQLHDSIFALSTTATTTATHHNAAIIVEEESSQHFHQSENIIHHENNSNMEFPTNNNNSSNNNNKIHRRRILNFEDWPLSRIDQQRRANNNTQKDHYPLSTKIALPTMTTATTPTKATEDGDDDDEDRTIIEDYCPNCLSDLTNAVYGKHILLLGHELLFAGGEIWLRDFATMLETYGGAYVRILFLVYPEQERPLLQSHIDQGLSYLFYSEYDDDNDDKSLDNNNTMKKNIKAGVNFTSFDYIIANTAAIESWYNFFEYYESSNSKSSKIEEMEDINKKIIYCIHEYKPDEFLTTTPFLRKHLPLVKKIIFDSDAGKQQWIQKIPTIESTSVTISPGIPEKTINSLVKVSSKKKKVNLRQTLKIPTIKSDDVVFLQAASIQERKGTFELIAAFRLMFEQYLPNELIQDRSWFLIVIGHPASEDDEQRVEREIRSVNSYLQNNKKSMSRIIQRSATSDIASYYGAADVFVLNSECENFGLVFVEAMFTSRPTIGRDCGGARTITEHGKTGLLLPNRQENRIELAQTFANITTGPNWKEKLDSMGSEAKKRAIRNFSYAQMAHKFSRVFLDDDE